MKILRFATVAGLIALLCVACASSTVTAFKDPAYNSKSFQKLVVFTSGMTLEAGLQFESEICAKVSPTPCEPAKNILPPTRDYTGEEILSVLTDSNIDVALIVNLTSDESVTNYLGSISKTDGDANTIASTSGFVNSFGNGGTYSGTTTANTSYSSTTTKTPVYQKVRAAFGEVALMDIETAGIAWRGEIKTSGSGALSVTNSAFISSATSEIANQLKATGFFELTDVE